ncbi:hypothetical protein KCP78_01820 [Salmonella enterica subsp. enterica]|nr:hypothetical protein KCP78_01820 [Salmonella enterica subsp. enterica]
MMRSPAVLNRLGRVCSIRWAYRRPSDTASSPQLCANHQPATGRMIVVRINDRGPWRHRSGHLPVQARRA